MNDASARRLDLDRAKGLGILLVVIGHTISKETPPGNDWYELLHYAIYQFHMPFFMYLSGYVVFLTGANRTTSQNWPNLVSKRAYRLLLPFLIFGVVVVAGKLIASQFIYVDKVPNSVMQAVVSMVWNTDDSPSASVWYIAVLFVFCILTPPVMWVARGRAVVLVMLTAILYLLPIPHVLYLNRMADYFLFFSLGGLAADAGGIWLGAIEKNTWWFIAAFLLVVMAFCLPQAHQIPWKVKLLVSGVLSMPALHGLILRSPLNRDPLFLWFGVYSFVIYLLNTPCMGLAKGVLLRFMSWSGVNFLLFFAVMTLAGAVGPIFIKKYILRWWRPIDRITN